MGVALDAGFIVHGSRPDLFTISFPTFNAGAEYRPNIYPVNNFRQRKFDQMMSRRRKLFASNEFGLRIFSEKLQIQRNCAFLRLFFSETV